MGGDPSGMGTDSGMSAGMGGAEGAAATNPYVAGAMAAKAGVDAVGGAAESMASEATGDDETGPGMQ